MSERHGAKLWYVPDAYYPASSSGRLPSHEAICVLNPSRSSASIEIILYFEDREKMGGFHAACPAERTNHIRMDRMRDSAGNGVPAGVPYAMMVRSDVEIIVQYSRMDTTQAELALMTTLAYPLAE